MKFFFSVLVISLFLLSCSKRENRFIDIPKANAEILERTGIEILAFKDQIEKDFVVDESFYDSILLQTVLLGTNEIFKKNGYYSVRTNGDTITGNDVDSILYHFAHGFANGIIEEHCSPSDSLCLAKMKYRKNLLHIQLPYGRIESSTTEFIYFDLYKKDYLTKEEFSFMTLWWYILSSAQGISDEEWRKQEKKR